MVNRILSLIGWLGTALVFVAVAIRFGYPAKEQYAYYLAWGGLVCVLLYTLGQWREIANMFGRRQARYGTLAATSVLVVLGILIAINYIGAQQHKRWDLTANKQFSLSDQTRNIVTKLDAPLQVQVFARKPADFSGLSTTGCASTSSCRKRSRPSTSTRTRSRRPRRRPTSRSTARFSSTTRLAPSGLRPTPSRTSPTRSSRW